MSETIPPTFIEAIELAHPSWHDALRAGLRAMHAADRTYLEYLAQDQFLPTDGRLFAAFLQPVGTVRFVLIGEGPYPRTQSATGFCFMDGAVDELWSENGLSKAVNRATSLRNFMKMLMVADGMLAPSDTTGEVLREASSKARHSPATVQRMEDLQNNFLAHGFLLLNAALVYRKNVPPQKESAAWRHFLEIVLMALSTHAEEAGGELPTLVLWGKIAEKIAKIGAADAFPKVLAEHPYNLSFILNPAMHELFNPMRFLRKNKLSANFPELPL